MEKIKIKITDKLGVYGKAAYELSNTASKFKSNIIVHHNGTSGDMKSIMNFMALAIGMDEEIEITFDGADAGEAAKAVKEQFITLGIGK